MTALLDKIRNSPVLVRVVPFVVFLLLTYGQGKFGEASRYWFYLCKTVVGAWLLWVVWRSIRELSLRFSWEAVVVGVGVFVMWVGLDGLYPGLDELLAKVGLGGSEVDTPEASPEWNPHLQFGAGSMLAWLFISVRFLGSICVVPALEEVFYRSFLYRYIAKPDFESVPLGKFVWVPFLVTALIFGFTHHQWLAGILCGFAYQGLVCWKKRLGDVIVAHAITNFILAVWVVWRGAWNFW